MLLSLRQTYLLLVVMLTGALILVAGCVSEPESEPLELSSASEPADLTYYTEQLPPSNYQENGTLQGISVDLLEAITEKMGKKVSREEVNLVPWTVGYQAALTQNDTVLFSMARTSEREDSFKWAGPIYTNRKVLFAKPEMGITIENSEDLKGYRIGVITDDIAIQHLLEIGVNQSQIVPESNVSTIIAALDNGEIDLWACPETAGRYFTEQATGNNSHFTVVYQLHTQDLYYAFSKDIPDSRVRSFQQALDDLKQEEDAEGISEYERILGQYLPAIDLD